MNLIQCSAVIYPTADIKIAAKTIATKIRVVPVVDWTVMVKNATTKVIILGRSQYMLANRTKDKPP
jgi:hypothetical protein